MLDLIPVLATIFVLGPAASWAFSLTPLGKAIVERLRGRATGSDDLLDMQDEIERLHEHTSNQDQRIDELHERLDFAERLLVEIPSVPAVPDEVVTPV